MTERPPAAVVALPGGHWRAFIAPCALHLRHYDEHKPVWAVGIERLSDDRWLAGASYFRNSFGQPCACLHLGEQYEHLAGVQALFLQWSAGLMYSCRGRFKSEVPLNSHGFSPGA